jgi:ketosteroid isomerase-like protein
MSHENVEIVRRGTALLNAGDWETAFALYHPDAEYRDLQHAPDMPEVFHGHAGLRGEAVGLPTRRCPGERSTPVAG